MNELLQALLKLQAIEFGEAKGSEGDIAELRSKVPPQIIGHFDRLIARGKKGVAVVRNQTCGGCHMNLPIGTINTLMQASDIQLCGTCGRYLYLPTPAEAEAAAPVAAPKPAPKRKRKVLANAA